MRQVEFHAIPGLPEDLEFTYRDVLGQISHRRVSIKAIGVTPGAEGALWLTHIRGHCHQASALRTFDVTHISGATDPYAGGAPVTDPVGWFAAKAQAKIVLAARSGQTMRAQRHPAGRPAIKVPMFARLPDAPPEPQRRTQWLRVALVIGAGVLAIGAIAVRGELRRHAQPATQREALAPREQVLHAEPWPDERPRRGGEFR
jgi:hypothetical protein